MFLTAWGPRRSASCARYRLGGVTGVPGESEVPSGRLGSLSNGRGVGTFGPRQPIIQLIALGGCWTT
jgi:hypothetical protein